VTAFQYIYQRRIDYHAFFTADLAEDPKRELVALQAATGRYPCVHDAADYHAIVHRLAKGYLDVYYETDAALLADADVRDFAAFYRSQRNPGANATKLPPLDGKETLSRLVRMPPSKPSLSLKYGALCAVLRDECPPSWRSTSCWSRPTTTSSARWRST
jgi:hypothetical protein